MSGSYSNKTCQHIIFLSFPFWCCQHKGQLVHEAIRLSHSSSQPSFSMLRQRGGENINFWTVQHFLLITEQEEFPVWNAVIVSPSVMLRIYKYVYNHLFGFYALEGGSRSRIRMGKSGWVWLKSRKTCEAATKSYFLSSAAILMCPTMAKWYLRSSCLTRVTCILSLLVMTGW